MQENTESDRLAAKPVRASPPRQRECPPPSAAKFVICDHTIETNLRHLKQTMGLDVLHCQRLVGVLKELTVFALVYNLVRVVMLEAAKRQGVALERVRFVDALRWLSTARPGDSLPPLVVNPSRPDRVEPRAVKRRPKPYPLLTQPRRAARNALRQQPVGA